MSIELDDISSGYSTGKINENFQKVEDEFNTNVLRRDGLSTGEANQMEVDLDMNSQRILNLPEPVNQSEAARLQDVQNAIAGDTTANLISLSAIPPYSSENLQGFLEELVEDAPGDKVSAVNTISELQSTDWSAYEDGKGVYVTDPLRGGLFRWHPSGTQDDGGIYFQSGSGYFERVEKSPVNVQWYGAVPGADCTLAIQSCADANGEVGFPASDSSYLVDSIETTVETHFFAIGGEATVLLDTPSVAYTPGFTFSHSGSTWDWNLKLDGGNTSRTGILVNTGADNCHINLDVKNISADLGSSNITAGLSALIVNDLHFSVNGENILNSGHANESVPRVVSLQDGTNRFVCDRISSKNTGCVFLASDAKGTVSLLDIHNAEDNGIYALGDVDIALGKMVYRGSEEAVVVGGANAKVEISSLHVIGDALYCLGVQDHYSLVVDSLVISKDLTTDETAGGIFRTRSANTSAGAVIINAVSGVIRPERLIATENGDLDRFVMKNVNLDVIVADGTSWTPSFFVNLDSVTGYCRIANWDIRVTQEAGATTSVGTVEIQMPSSGTTYPSLYESINISVPSGANFRGKLAYPNVVKKNVAIRTDVGPYARQVNLVTGDTSYGVHSINGVPTTGYWHAGEDYALLPKSTAPFRARCTASGTPGTWVTY